MLNYKEARCLKNYSVVSAVNFKMDLEASIEKIIIFLEKYRHLIDTPPTALYVNENYKVIP